MNMLQGADALCTAIVGPAHLAVRESSWRMALLAAQAPGAGA